MTMIAIECSHCGTSTDVPAASVLVDVGVETRPEVAGSLSWICDRCHEVATQPVKWSVLLLVVAAAALLFEEDEHEPTPHPEAPPAGCATDRNDLFKLHRELDEPAWCSQVEAQIDSQQPGGAR